MNNDFTTMTPEQRRGKRWLIQIVRIREVAEFRYVAVEARARIGRCGSPCKPRAAERTRRVGIRLRGGTAFDIEDIGGGRGEGGLPHRRGWQAGGGGVTSLAPTGAHCEASRQVPPMATTS